MQFSELWLREFINPKLDTKQLADQLSTIGLEVDNLSAILSQDINRVVIGQIIAIELHPNADKLRVCKVITAPDQPTPLTIVCGASNVSKDLKVPVAQLGASLPQGIKIKRAKLRGVASEGMICSASELGLAESSPGILPLPEDAPLGEDFCDYYQLHDHIINLDLTPNRADCLSILGVARDLAAKNDLPLKSPRIKPIAAVTDQHLSIKNQATEACPKYLSRIIKAINTEAKTPLWMQEKLRRSGISTIHPLVDVTNYVMLELGQPMHAFDLHAIQGSIKVRYAKAEETLNLLNKSSITLDTNDLVIADDSKPIALAGIMGGLETAVQTTTEDLVLEAAYFNKTQISRTCQRTHIHSDSSHRFERGVDPTLPELAIERATELILSICGGEPGQVKHNTSQDHLPPSRQIALDLNKLQIYSGFTMSADQVISLLARLDCTWVKDASNGTFNKANLLHFTVPSYRFDLTQDVDLIEEIIRMTGYDAIASTMPKIAARPYDPAHQLNPNHNRAVLNQLKQRLTSYGFYQVINYSFISQKAYQNFYQDSSPSQKQLQATRPALQLANPISEDLSVMRPSLLFSLTNNLAYNLNRQKDQIKLFELANVYAAQSSTVNTEDQNPSVKEQPVKEQQCLAGLAYVQNKHHQDWQAEKQPYSFFDFKGEFTASLALILDPAHIKFTAEQQHPLFHPGQCARLDIAGKHLGYMGALAPRLLQPLKLPKQHKVYAFEIYSDILLAEQKISSIDALSKYPSITRDLTLLVKKDFTYQTLALAIESHAGQYLKSLNLISLYAGEGVNSNDQAISLRLKWQAPNRTLKEEEITDTITNLLAYLAQKYQITLKDT